MCLTAVNTRFIFPKLAAFGPSLNERPRRLLVGREQVLGGPLLRLQVQLRHVRQQREQLLLGTGLPARCGQGRRAAIAWKQGQ